MDHLSCEFCNSRVGPILPQDMGEGRTMHLCPRCRAYIRQGEATYQRQLAQDVITQLHRVVRNASGRRSF